MTDTQFFYWLQGYFELSGSKEPLSPEQAACIEKHAALIRASLVPGEKICERVRVVETMAKLLRQEYSTAIARTCTTAIRSTIHEQFEHVIDPAAGGPEQQAKLNAIHHGGHPLPGEKPIMRC
jgi:chromosome condensin MukBEF ATPase and DNA-binding subunit MukB